MSNDTSFQRPAWRERLAELLAAPVEAIGTPVPGWDDLLRCAGSQFAIEYRARADAASVAAALEQVQARRSALSKGAMPLLVVDAMGERGRELCARAGVDWFDLAGNASITHVSRLRVVVEGKKPPAKPRGRPRNAFATKSSRVAHWLLLNHGRAGTHAEIAEATGVDKGHLSRIVERLEELQLVRREPDGLRLAKPAAMLDAWREAYSPPARTIVRGVIPSRSSEETVRKVAAVLKAAGNQHAFGGLAAAWMLDGFADFRIATCYVDGSLDPSALKEVGFLEGERGANLWLMMDADPVALMGATRIRATHVASPFFTYVDLAAHPERSREAAGHLLEHILGLEASHAV